MIAVINVRKWQTDMPFQGEHQTLTKKSIRHHVCHGETCCTFISDPP